MSHDVKEMTGKSNDVREECYITVLTSVSIKLKSAQSKPVSCYENTFISNLGQLCKKIYLIFYIFFVCFTVD